MLVGLTGGIGSGKSEVSRRLAERGAVVVDMDALAREVLSARSEGAALVAAEFGLGVLDAGGAVDRDRLAAVVFADPGARARLEAIVHPRVRQRAAEITLAAPPGAVVVHDVPLLVESGLAGGYDVVVVVTSSEENRLHRLVALRGMREADARARMAAQATEEERRAVADFLVPNDGSLASLGDQVDRLWVALADRADRADAGRPGR